MTNDINAVSFGPCWCNGDSTTGGHWHGSADGGNVPQTTVTVEAFPYVLNRILYELQTIRALMEKKVDDA